VEVLKKRSAYVPTEACCALPQCPQQELGYRWLVSLLAIVPIGAIMRRQRSQSRVARSAIRRTRRPKAGALLTVILVGAWLERREDGRSPRGAVGGRDDGQPVTGGARGSARAAASRAPQV